nr:HlyD family efflux transporter periplasmic adaptor subunit [Desulfobulbaceae bacterium]
QLKSASELDVAVSKARVARAEAEVELRRSMVTKCTIEAPFAGRVISRAANPFQYVTPGQPLLQVIDDANLTVQLFVPSHWLNWIKPGLPFKVKIDETNTEYKAQLTVLGAKVDQVSQTLEVRAKIDGNHPELLAGMSGTAYFKK